MTKLAIIPARSGSKRIPNKNTRIFNGKPIITYSIEAAHKSGLFEEVMVSTDSEEIGEIASRYGASFPFTRSPENADDYATTTDVLLEVIQKYAGLGKTFDYICCIYPTAIFVNAEKLQKAFDLMQSTDSSSCLPIVSFSYPIRRGLGIDPDGRAFYLWPENKYKRSQDLTPAYHDAGQFYWLELKAFLDEKDLILKMNTPLIVPETEVQDIDHETDWEIAELKHQLFNSHTYLHLPQQ